MENSSQITRPYNYPFFYQPTQENITQDDINSRMMEVDDTPIASRINLLEFDQDADFSFPEEIQLKIFSYLSISELSYCSCVSKRWRTATSKALSEYLLCNITRKSGTIDPKLIREVKKNPTLQNLLFGIIYASRERENKLKHAAAAAIMLLNEARISFSKKDFHGINIKGATLDRAVMDHVNLQGADLRNVQFNSTWLRKANMRSARLENALFTQYSEKPENKSSFLCSFSRNMKYKATYDNSIIIIHNIESPEKRPITIRTNQTQCLAFNPKGTLLASNSSWDIEIWDVRNGKCKKTLYGHEDDVFFITFSPDGKHIATASDDDTVRIWNCLTGKNIRTFNCNDLGTQYLAFSSDGKQLFATMFFDEAKPDADSPPPSISNLYFWDLCTKNTELRQVHTTRPVGGIAFSSDGRFVAIEFFPFVELHDIKNNEYLFSIPLEKEGISHLEFINNDSEILCIADEKWRIWKISDKKRKAILLGSNSVTLECEGIKIDNSTIYPTYLKLAADWNAMTKKPLQEEISQTPFQLRELVSSLVEVEKKVGPDSKQLVELLLQIENFYRLALHKTEEADACEKRAMSIKQFYSNMFFLEEAKLS